jgi:predicted metal-dependent peptidase
MSKPRLSAEKRIELVHVSLMRAPAFQAFVGLFMVGKISVEDGVRTACTNGRDVLYGRSFVDGLSDKELAFLVMHENMHKCYRHLTTWRAMHDVNHSLANQACDYVVNIQLTDMDASETMIAFPRDPATNKRIGHYDERFRGMNAKQVFDILRDEEKKPPPGRKPPQPPGPKGDGPKPPPGDQPCDEPGDEPGDEPSDDGENGHQPGDGNDRQDDDNSGGAGEPDDSGGFDEHDWQGAKDIPAEEKQKLEHEIEQALRQGGIYAGKMGGKMSREIGDMLKPKVDWREVLRRFVKTYLKDRQSPSWRKAHRNYLWQDVILPSILGKRMKHLVIGIDTSGSIQGPILTAFLSELNRIVTDSNPERVDVIYWDAQVAGHEIYKGTDSKTIVHKTSPTGGGGTDPDVVAAFMVKEKLEPDALVILSDGYMHSSPANWTAIRCPSLWCIMGNSNYKPPHGQVVNVKEE